MSLSMHRSMRIQSISNQQPPLAEKITEEPVTNKTAQSTVICIYHANIAGYWRNVTVLWCKNLMNHSLSITIDGLDGDSQHTCKIDLKPWHFWSKKGYKSMEIDNSRVEFYWDLRSAKFSGGPEPCSDYYIALVSDDEVVLLLGDCKKKAYKRTKARPALVDAVLFCKKENVFAKKSFSTKARFDEKAKEHEIVVESSTSGPKDPEMWVSIDGIVLLHVRNLQWKFRGNQTVHVSKLPVQIFWDVHSWLFGSPGTGAGLFIFKPGVVEGESDMESGSRGDSESDNSSGSRYYPTQNYPASPEFSLYLYAWKIE